MKDKVGYRRILDILKDVDRVDSKLILWELLTEEQSVALKKHVSTGKIIGPRIFTARRLINGPQIQIPFVEKQVKTEQEVRQEVRLQAAIGVDYIKLYVGLTPSLVRAAIDEAQHNGIKVTPILDKLD